MLDISLEQFLALLKNKGFDYLKLKKKKKLSLLLLDNIKKEIFVSKKMEILMLEILHR